MTIVPTCIIPLLPNIRASIHHASPLDNKTQHQMLAGTVLISLHCPCSSLESHLGIFWGVWATSYKERTASGTVCDIRVKNPEQKRDLEELIVICVAEEMARRVRDPSLVT